MQQAATVKRDNVFNLRNEQPVYERAERVLTKAFDYVVENICDEVFNEPPWCDRSQAEQLAEMERRLAAPATMRAVFATAVLHVGGYRYTSNDEGGTWIEMSRWYNTDDGAHAPDSLGLLGFRLLQHGLRYMNGPTRVHPCHASASHANLNALVRFAARHGGLVEKEAWKRAWEARAAAERWIGRLMEQPAQEA
jgi:hypothetical protein